MPKITELPEKAVLAATDLLPLVDMDGTPVTVHAALEALRVYALTSTVNVQTTDSYTLVLEDAFRMVAMDSAIPCEIVIPPNSTTPFPLDTRIDVAWDGDGQVTITPDVGVTVRTPETLKLRKQWAKATLIKRGTDTWDLEGNLEAAP